MSSALDALRTIAAARRMPGRTEAEEDARDVAEANGNVLLNSALDALRAEMDYRPSGGVSLSPRSLTWTTTNPVDQAGQWCAVVASIQLEHGATAACVHRGELTYDQLRRFEREEFQPRHANYYNVALPDLLTRL